ncbi:hypothetical protein DMUE_4588 [Dictyocoela muelleri]|nr:hypothetical protein DMUE_4588 [Dictyocoela muelleri]
MKQKYLESDALKYMTSLTTVRQNNYPAVEEYKLEIEDKCRKLMKCLDGGATDEKLKIRETFYNELSDRTKLEMSRLNIQDINLNVSDNIINRKNNYRSISCDKQ